MQKKISLIDNLPSPRRRIFCFMREEEAIATVFCWVITPPAARRSCETPLRHFAVIATSNWQQKSQNTSCVCFQIFNVFGFICLPVVSVRGCWCVTGRRALQAVLTKADMVRGLSSAAASILSMAKPQYKMSPCFLIAAENSRGKIRYSPCSCNISTGLKYYSLQGSVLQLLTNTKM